MNHDARERILKQLRTPSTKADMLIEQHLDYPGGNSGCRPYTSDVESALMLLPHGVHFLCGRFEGAHLFWCDVGFRPQVQAWGETMAAAVAGAIFAYRTHPEASAATGAPQSVTGV
jgi:hypothetical protein